MKKNLYLEVTLANKQVITGESNEQEETEMEKFLEKIPDMTYMMVETSSGKVYINHGALQTAVIKLIKA